MWAAFPVGRGGWPPRGRGILPTVHDLHEVLRLPGVRRIELGWGLSVAGEIAGMVTLVAYAFDVGGARLAAAYVASRTLAAMCVALGIAGVTGTVRRDTLLRRLTGLRAVLLALAALTAAARQGPPAGATAGRVTPARRYHLCPAAGVGIPAGRSR